MEKARKLVRKRGRPTSDPSRDLRSQLLETSRALLNEGGPALLSMREVARRASCTHQAPYHYFQDRESILAALVCDGFSALAQRMRVANDLAESRGPRATLVAAAHAYVGFALREPGIFRIMFRPDMCDPARFPEVVATGRQARAELERLNQIACRTTASSTTATILWSHVHGLSCLLLDGPMGGPLKTPRQRQAHLDRVAQAFAEMVVVANPRSEA